MARMGREPTHPADDAEIRDLYRRMLDGWNRRSAEAMAAPFAEDAEIIGFDGSQMIGRPEIISTLHSIFADHQTATYVSIVRSVRVLGRDAAILRAAVGMAPRGQSELNSAVNAWQTVVAARRNAAWQIVLLQNTPAQFHGRPDLAQQFTDELRELLP